MLLRDWLVFFYYSALILCEDVCELLFDRDISDVSRLFATALVVFLLCGIYVARAINAWSVWRKLV